MMQTIKRPANRWVIVAVISTMTTASVSFAALLGVIPGHPNINYDSSGTTTYDAITNQFSVNASPIAIQFSPGDPPVFIMPSGAPPSPVLQIQINVNGAGVLVGGVPGDDIVIQGSIDTNYDSTPEYQGVLLTGEILQFGYSDSGGPTDAFDFRFVPTGGQLASYFNGKDIGVTLTSEHSTFVGSFVVPFAGGAKGYVGPIDTTNHPPVCDAGSSYTVECAGGMTTVALDATASHDEDNDPLTYSWTTTCANATFNDAASPTPILTINTVGLCTYDCSVTLRVSDGKADPSECMAEIHVRDRNAPMITCPPDVSRQCSQPTTIAATGSATATDECDPAPVVTSSDEIVPGNCPKNYVIKRTWTARDRCNNSMSCVQTITVSDTTPPVITCPGQRQVTCQQGTLPSVTGSATAADNCDPAPTITYADTVDDACCPTVAVITRRWTATDRCGNSSSCNQIIRVIDNAAPIVHCPPDKTIGCHDSTSPNNTGWATATDSCDPVPTLIYSDTWLCGECPRVLQRKWKAKDHCGNTSSWCIQYIRVADTTPPTINCPPDKTLNCGCSSTSPSVTGYATASDNCDTCPTISYSDQCTGTCPKTIRRTWKAKDDCNNQSTCVQTITLIAKPPCPHSCNYWKCYGNRWPCNSMNLGSTCYNSTKHNNMLRCRKPNGDDGAGDASIELARQLIAVKFSLLNGTPPGGIDSTVSAAESWLNSHAPGCRPTGSARNYALAMAACLEDFCSHCSSCDDEGDDDCHAH